MLAPTLNLPFGEGHKWATSGVADAVFGGWSVTTVITYQSGFPIGVSQNVSGTPFLFSGSGSNTAQLRPNLVPGSIRWCPATSRTGFAPTRTTTCI